MRDDVPSGTQWLGDSARGELPGDSARGELPGWEEDPRAVLDALPAVIGYYGADLRNRGANRAYVEFFGLTPDEIHGRHISEVIGPDLYELNRPHIAGVLGGESQLFDRTLIDPRGEPRHMQVSYIPDISDGKVRGFAVLLTDITARRIAEQALLAAEARFRGLLESAPDAMVIVKADSRGEIVLVNAQAERLFGYTREELLGKGMEMLMPERFRDRHEHHRCGYAANPHARPMGAGLELLARRNDGSEFPVEVSLGPLQSAEGLLLSSAIRDITDRKRVEDELHHSREQLAEAERVARTGSLEWDLISDHTTWSDGLFAMHGLTPDQFDPSSAGADQRVYPEDRQRVRQTLERAIADRSLFTLEYRAMRADGRVRTLRSHGEVVVDPTGEPVRVVAIVQDITDARLAQEALQSTSADLERRATELQQLALLVATQPPATPHAPLTPRQLEILRLVAQGHTSAAIAARLFVTEGTIKWHVKQILAKTNSATRAEAVARVLGRPQ
jgi:PAS domain S-box-containing protein